MMRSGTLTLLLTLALACFARGQTTRDVRDVVGVTHVAGLYHLTDKDFLNEGADQILALGSRVIKVWFYAGQKGRVPDSYPYNSRWPKVESLVEGAKTPYFKELFGKPFTTYILVVAIPSAVRTALDWGCPYVVYWELYCNELKDPSAKGPQTREDGVWEPLPPVVGANNYSPVQVRGFWLIRPDGTKAWTWDYFHGLFTATRADFKESMIQKKAGSIRYRQPLSVVPSGPWATIAAW